MAGDVLEASVDRGWLYHPAFPDHWTPRSLHSMARWVNGIAFKDIQFMATGRPVVKIAEIKGGISGQTKFTQQTFDESVRVRPGDLLFSWSGQPETSIDAFWWRGPEGWLNQHVFRVTPEDGIDTVFFYYLLRYLKPNFVGIARNKQTTGLGHVTKRDLENLKVSYPELPEQRAIAHILGKLDDKIELNRRMSATLEAMARALFKAWFVDFEPVRAKAEGRDPGLPKPFADLFPDAFEVCELGELPVGWAISSVYDIASYVNGAAYRDFNPNQDGQGLPIVKIAELKAGVTAQTAFSVEMPEKYLIDTCDILFSWSGNPDTSIDTFVWTHGPAWLNQHIFRVVPRNETERAFVLMALRFLRPVFAEIARNKQTTGLGHVTVADLKRLVVALPPKFVLLRWNSFVEPLIERGFRLAMENKAIGALRDTLLPKLISGELRVKDAETFLDRML